MKWSKSLKLVDRSQVGFVVRRKSHAVSCSHLEKVLRSDSSLEVDVELDLRCGTGPRFRAGAGCREA